MSKAGRWQFWVDRGGTFTDIVAKQPDGQLVTHKLLSESPHYNDAALQGIRELLCLADDAPLPENSIASIKMGTTLGTNALLEKQGEATALVINRGFADSLAIGYQNRADLFALHIKKPDALYRTVVEVQGRHDARGEEIIPLDLTGAEQSLRKVYQSGIRSLAIVMLHSWINPAHEIALSQLARTIGFTQISASHQVSPLMKLVSRGETTVVDAYLSPILQRYIESLQQGLGPAISHNAEQLLFMQSSGGLISADQFRGKDSILSGPAGGMIGAIATARQEGISKIISFDMGGTSTDVAHFGGELERCYESEVAGIRLRVPMMNIHTVAAGGGSLLIFDGMRYRVGPRSAGAYPGPASYGHGGPLTVTDANVLLGKIQPRFFPCVFGADARQPLDKNRVVRLFEQLAHQIATATGEQQLPEQVAQGFIRIAVENMAAAIKKISIQRGFDLSQYALSCFGGAGGQHACQVAEHLGIRRIILHPFAGVLSAYGMGLADCRLLRQIAIEQPLTESLLPELSQQLAQLETRIRESRPFSVSEENEVHCEQRIHLRYQGTDSSFVLPFAADHAMLKSRFQQQHRQRFGFDDEHKPLVVEALAVELIAPGANLQQSGYSQDRKTWPEPDDTVHAHFSDTWQAIPLFQRDKLKPGMRLSGPAMIIEKTGTTLVDPGWDAQVTLNRQLILLHTHRNDSVRSEETARAVLLEVFNKRFMSIAEQMGYTLQNTAQSVNIKERLDFSCALFDRQGRLIANAPHIPVHLGSMSECVKQLIQQKRHAIDPGDVFLSNSPFHGGTHLPDLTVISPFFGPQDNAPRFYLAARGHHADIGGKTPGSMPADSTSIEQEGLCFQDFKIVSRGQFRENALREALDSGPYPARKTEQNLADLRAQVAANNRGSGLLDELLQEYGLATVEKYMAAIRENAEQAVRRVIAKLQNGEAETRLDDDSVIRVAIRIDQASRSAQIDFSGSSPQHPGNLNAPAAVARAAVMYVFRCLVDDDIPLNEGCLTPLEIILPEGSILNPEPPAAVVAGNVETSQCIVDTLFAALNKLAGSQGTMNNLTFGNERHQYYETICGGSGAGDGFDGCDAIQTHMTNSRLTDPEVLETRFPVRLEKFAIRHNSGGEGKNRGGNGVIREIRFLQPMQASIISNHRRYPPSGLAGGKPAKCGQNTLKQADGHEQKLASNATVTLALDDSLVIETPGGGGYG